MLDGLIIILLLTPLGFTLPTPSVSTNGNIGTIGYQKKVQGSLVTNGTIGYQWYHW